MVKPRNSGETEKGSPNACGAVSTYAFKRASIQNIDHGLPVADGQPGAVWAESNSIGVSSAHRPDGLADAVKVRMIGGGIITVQTYEAIVARCCEAAVARERCPKAACSIMILAEDLAPMFVAVEDSQPLRIGIQDGKEATVGRKFQAFGISWNVAANALNEVSRFAIE
jgi:hypothetical protein